MHVRGEGGKILRDLLDFVRSRYQLAPVRSVMGWAALGPGGVSA